MAKYRSRTTSYCNTVTLIFGVYMNSSGIYCVWDYGRPWGKYEWILYWRNTLMNCTSGFIHHTLTMKIRSSLIGICCIVALSGCWSSSDVEAIIVTLWEWETNVAVTIPAEFEQIPSALVENRQIINQILYSGRVPLTEDQIENSETYSLNLVITQSSISTWITYDQFAQTNMDKMQQYMIWYTKDETTLLNFDCGEEEISWIQTTFTIKDNYHQAKWMYLFYHYQFVYDNQWYIISLAWLPSESKALKNTFENITDSLACSWN